MPRDFIVDEARLMVAIKKSKTTHSRAMVGREMDMIGLKRQMNALAHELGREAPFALAFLEKPDDGATSPVRAMGATGTTRDSA